MFQKECKHWKWFHFLFFVRQTCSPDSVFSGSMLFSPIVFRNSLHNRDQKHAAEMADKLGRVAWQESWSLSWIFAINQQLSLKIVFQSICSGVLWVQWCKFHTILPHTLLFSPCRARTCKAATVLWWLNLRLYALLEMLTPNTWLVLHIYLFIWTL